MELLFYEDNTFYCLPYKKKLSEARVSISKNRNKKIIAAFSRYI